MSERDINHGFRPGRSDQDAHASLRGPGPDGTWDVVVIGGGAAGLSGAMNLARVRRSVLVIDAGEPRNAPAAAAHGLLGRDGIPPLQLLRQGREEVASYGGRVVTGRVEAVRREGGRLAVRTADGRRAVARRLLVTSGLTDELPAVPGLAALWGRDVLHCVFCHGWEARDTAVGVLGSYHHALMFRQVTGDVTLFPHDGPAPAGEQRQRLDALGIGVAGGRVSGVETDGQGRLAGVRLDSGNTVPVRTLVVAPRFRARAAFLRDLGLAAREHPSGTGEHLPVDATGFTGVEGVWAAGNVTDPMANVTVASAAGVTASGAIVMSLLAEDADAAEAASGGGGAR